MGELKTIKELALHSVRGTTPENFELSDVDSALRNCLNEMSGSINKFMKNRYDIYEIIIETADEITPKKVIENFEVFSEIATVAQGQKKTFKKRVGRKRAKQFLTQVGLSGVYETFRLDSKTYEVRTKAIGGAATIDFERFLDGEEDMNELMEIIVEGQTEAIYGEVQKALIAAYDATDRPDANKHTGSTFSAIEMQKLVTVAKSYGDTAVIFAPPEFIDAMGPDAIVPATSTIGGVYATADINDIHETGRIKMFRGTPIVEIPQSFVDENNEKTVVNPQYAYVLPTGKEKVVKLVMEGGTQVYDTTNADQSMEINTYRKVGTAILSHHDWCIYRNTGIADTFK